MLDIKFIKENAQLIKEAAEKKHIAFDVDVLLALEEKRKSTLTVFENLRAEQNRLSDEIPKTTDQTQRAKLIEDLKPLKEKVGIAEEESKLVMKQWQTMMLEVPNIPDVSVPEGKDDTENKEVRKWGQQPNFSFKPKNHVELMETLDLVDFDRGAKVAGFRGYFLKGDAALLQFALWNYFLNGLLKKGFTPMSVPSLVNKATLYGTGYLPQGQEDLYHTQDDTYLAGTGEVATMSYYSDEVLAKESLPKKIVAFSASL